MGKMYIDHTGIMRINNTGSGMVAKVKFKEASRLSSKDAHQVTCLLLVGMLGSKSDLAVLN